MDTACSSALVATHLALKHLQSSLGSSLAGGVNLLLAETTTAATMAAGMLAPDGRCKALDAAADGYVRCCRSVLLLPVWVAVKLCKWQIGSLAAAGSCCCAAGLTAQAPCSSGRHLS